MWRATPSEEQLDEDPLLSRFTIVFDREGYSPQFFAQMKEQRIAVLTYHKFPYRYSEVIHQSGPKLTN